MRTITTREQLLVNGKVRERIATHIVTGAHGYETLCTSGYNLQYNKERVLIENCEKVADGELPVTCHTCLNRPGFPGECFICELRLPDHCFRWKHNKLFLLLPEEYGPAFPAIVDCYTSPPTLVWPVPLLHGFSSSYGVLPPLCKDH